MSQNSTPAINGLASQAMRIWHRFSDSVEPLRPELYRYCRALTRSAWDAEDLVQDTLARALVTLGSMFQEIRSPRAWLFRVASNLWIDRQRHSRREDLMAVAPEIPVIDPPKAEAREAGATLIARLAPQERAALLLKDVFDFTLDETAEVLSTTPGAIKAALHRARGKLLDPDPPAAAVPRAPVLDAFCEAFNARDLDRLIALLLDTATAEISGIAVEYGPEKMRRQDTGSLYHTLFSPISHAVEEVHRAGDRGGAPRAEVREYHGEPLILCWYEHVDGPVVRDVLRIAADGDAISAIQFHFFSPDVLRDVSTELGVPWRSNGYRYWPFGG